MCFCPAAYHTPSSSLGRYFDPSEVDDVKKVYQAILGPTGWFGPPEMKDGALTVAYDMTTVLPPDGILPHPGCDDGTTLAYMGDNPEVPRMQITLCKTVFTYRSPYALDDLDCAMVGNFAFQNWLSIGASFLHEFTHWRKIMVPILGTETIDFKGDDVWLPVTGYGSYNSMLVNKFRKEGKKNADNYVWYVSLPDAMLSTVADMARFAIEAVYSWKCATKGVQKEFYDRKSLLYSCWSAIIVSRQFPFTMAGCNSQYIPVHVLTKP